MLTFQYHDIEACNNKATVSTNGTDAESFMRYVVHFILRMLKAVIIALHGARIIKKRVVERVTVE